MEIKECEKVKIVTHINERFSQSVTMSVVAEAESLASYSRKILALSYDRPTTPKSRKSHSPREDNMTRDVSAAMSE